MSMSFPQQGQNCILRLVENQVKNTLNNADEIMTAIHCARREIRERIEKIEKYLNKNPESLEAEKELAVLIQEDQYLQILSYKQKSELEEIFFAGRKTQDNCIYPDVLQWYQPPN